MGDEPDVAKDTQLEIILLYERVSIWLHMGTEGTTDTPATTSAVDAGLDILLVSDLSQ